MKLFKGLFTHNIDYRKIISIYPIISYYVNIASAACRKLFHGSPANFELALDKEKHNKKFSDFNGGKNNKNDKIYTAPLCNTKQQLTSQERRKMLAMSETYGLPWLNSPQLPTEYFRRDVD